MEYRVNGHVTTLNRFLPFDAGCDQLYEEHVRTPAVSLPANVLASICTITGRPVRLVVLTGDAGHGKTYICRHLLHAGLGLDDAAAYESIRTLDDGSTAADASVDLGQLANGRHLRLIRDLSDIVALSDRQTFRDLLMAA